MTFEPMVVMSGPALEPSSSAPWQPAQPALLKTCCAGLDRVRRPPPERSAPASSRPALDQGHDRLDLLLVQRPADLELQAGIGEFTLPDTTTPP